MALTNDQITAQNFKSFYNEIRPYLNGQVPTFANQFSRSDLYSTSEKIIGSWTDGKPLYQKSFVYDGTVPVGIRTKLGDIPSDANICFVTNSFGYYGTNETKISFPVYWNDGAYGGAFINAEDSGVYMYYFGYGSTFKNVNYTVCYTKTTDSAIKVGTGTDYSTEEQVVGTWIDGKPIYQKSGTYTFTESKIDTTVNMPITLTNIKDCIEASATIGGAILPIGSTGAYGIITLGAVTSTYVQLRLCGNQSLGSGDTVLFTVRYTKTTD